MYEERPQHVEIGNIKHQLPVIDLNRRGNEKVKPYFIFKTTLLQQTSIWLHFYVRHMFLRPTVLPLNGLPKLNKKLFSLGFERAASHFFVADKLPKLIFIKAIIIIQ